jgi:hypothetical protein
MLDSHNRNFCDICANRGPCHYCGSKGGGQPIKTLKSMLHEPCELMHVSMDYSGKISAKEMPKADIKNQGMENVPIVTVHENDTVFGIPDMPINELFKTHYAEYWSTIADVDQLGMTKIYIGVMK